MAIHSTGHAHFGHGVGPFLTVRVQVRFMPDGRRMAYVNDRWRACHMHEGFYRVKVDGEHVRVQFNPADG